MNLCADGHDEICHEGRVCPACELLKKISDMEDEISTLKDQLEEAQSHE
jgi:hypothetical protein